MKKLFLLFAIILLQVTGVRAQEVSDFYIIPTHSMGGKDKFGITGGIDGKSYMVTYSSNKKKKELFNSTINMLSEMNLVDKNKVKGKKVDENMTEVVVPFSMNTGIGIHGGTAPLHLYGDLRFEFYDGGMRLKVENFDEQFFVVHYVPEFGKEGTKTYQQYMEACQQANKVSGATSGFGKFMAKAEKLMSNTHIKASIGTKGVSSDAKQQITAKLNEANAERIKTLEDYRARVDEQERLFAKMAAADEGEWYTLPEYIKAVEKCKYFVKYSNLRESSMKFYQNALEGNKLYALTEKRWKRDIRYIFDGIFITLAEEVGCSIDGISEDGVLTWERDGELIVPTDSKMRAKFIKKGKSFTDYDSYYDN